MKFSLIPLLLFTLTIATAQTPEEEIESVITNLFDGMRESDSAKVHSCFMPNAQLYTALLNDGKPILQQGSLQKFLEAVGTPHDQIYNEPFWDLNIQVDGSLASAWASYAFYLGDQFLHCGVDAFHLFKTSEGWKVFHLTDTRRKADCDMPKSIKRQFE